MRTKGKVQQFSCYPASRSEAGYHSSTPTLNQSRFIAPSSIILLLSNTLLPLIALLSAIQILAILIIL